MSAAFRWVREKLQDGEKASGQRGRETEVKSLGLRSHGVTIEDWLMLTGHRRDWKKGSQGEGYVLKGKWIRNKAQKWDKPWPAHGLSLLVVRSWGNWDVVSLKGRLMPHTLVKSHWYNSCICVTCLCVCTLTYIYTCTCVCMCLLFACAFVYMYTFNFCIDIPPCALRLEKLSLPNWMIYMNLLAERELLWPVILLLSSSKLNKQKIRI